MLLTYHKWFYYATGMSSKWSRKSRKEGYETDESNE